MINTFKLPFLSAFLGCLSFYFSGLRWVKGRHTTLLIDIEVLSVLLLFFLLNIVCIKFGILLLFI